MRQRPVLEGGIDLPGAELIPLPDEDPSVPAELRAVLASVKLKTWRPRTGSQSRNRPSQPLLASSVPAG